MAASSKKMGANYTAADIEVMDGVQSVRLNPGMWIGGVDDEGITHLVRELVFNAVDEFTAGHGSQVRVTCKKDGTIIVADDARGLPTDIHPKSGLPVITTLCTMLFSGGKFGDAKKAYAASTGLHGVGLTVTCYLSDAMTVTVDRGAHRWEQSFSKGVATSEYTKTKNPSKRKSGTTISFHPDKKIFGDSRILHKEVQAMLDTIAYLCPGLTTVFTVEGKEPQVASHTGGLSEMLEARLESKRIAPIHKDPFVYRDENWDIAFYWTEDAGEHLYSFVNVSNLPEHGAHVTGVRNAITSVLSAQTKERVTGDDLREGLHFAIHMKVDKPVFRGQEKRAITNQELNAGARQIVTSMLTESLKDKKQAAVLRTVVDRAVELRKAREKSNKTTEAIRKMQSVGKGLLVGKLVKAETKKASERELFILEGLSASGSAKLGRDSKFQEILPLRGKILNAITTPASKFLLNAEVQSIVAALGTGIDLPVEEQVCNVEACRYGKIMWLMDADPDGRHIESLLAALFLTYFRPLIEAGRVYVVKSPLYIGEKGSKRAFGDSPDEIEAQLGKGASLTRLKGHGEANAEQLAEYALIPSRRKLVRLHIEDGSDADIRLLLGRDSLARKALLVDEED